ncbi:MULTISPECIES: AraC family transcriptional regulator [Pseudomonas]|uniref:AraC family transcriptional regulator n=1 Tax=Pseudomonas TaxID=286 RepID=UPI000CFB0B89|nr:MULTISPECIES: AraC family transcriptional regulator [Pseudomonas]PQZ84671.1 AraC family transcriptional regulator [Pseudomonas trivialis]PRB20700.1 AraC family transcriptional regulator [Pseudomonas sp. MYb60]
MRERTIASHYARAALGGARRAGHDFSALLQQVGITPELLSEPRARIAPEQFTRLLQLLWLALDDEYLGFAQAPSKRGTFAMMCHALIHCRTLEKALERGFLFYSLFPQGPRWQLTREGEMARLSLDDAHLWDPDHFLSECLLVIWHRLGSWLIGQRIRLHQVTFSYTQPPHASEYDLLFPCAQQFGAPNTSLVFPTRYLSLPLLQDERTLKHFLERSPADLLSRPDEGDSLSSQLRRLLSRDRTPWPDLDAVAQHLHISPQTLRRHLREEGTSFQALKDELRRDIAIYHLGRADLSLQAIAEQLGFSEPSAFHRAFKKWTGLTPGAYRAQES